MILVFEMFEDIDLNGGGIQGSFLFIPYIEEAVIVYQME